MDAHSSRTTPSVSGVEWIVDAHGCRPDSLRSVDVLSALFDRIVKDLNLHPVGPPVWHVFPFAGGVTGVLLLEESHLTCHTYPEAGFGAFDLYCCRPGAPWKWEHLLGEILGAHGVTVRSIARGPLP